MTRLFINIFFIVILCFTLAVLPINTEILDLFDFGTLFSNDDPIEEVETEPVDETFVPTFTTSYSLESNNRLYNPTTMAMTLQTNIPLEYEGNYDFDDLKMTLYRDDVVYQIFKHDSFVTSQEVTSTADLLQIAYSFDLSYEHLALDKDGFYKVEFSFESAEKSEIPVQTYELGYRPTINYVSNGPIENNGNFIYKAFFLNEDETKLVPLYFSVKYPERITVSVRNRLYNAPTSGYGLSTKQVIPDKTSISLIGTKHYGVFLYSQYFGDIIDSNEKAHLAIDALIQTLIRLPNIEKITLFVDDAQIEGSLYDIDLTKIYEAEYQSYAYLTEVTSSQNRYLVPLPVSEDNIYDEVWMILNLLQSEGPDSNMTQIIPPEIEFSNFIIEGTTITLDMNEAFFTVYADYPEYEKLMLNSILYSLTSIENISKVSFTMNGETVNDFAGMNLVEPVLSPPYINYIGEY